MVEKDLAYALREYPQDKKTDRLVDTTIQQWERHSGFLDCGLIDKFADHAYYFSLGSKSIKGKWGEVALKSYLYTNGQNHNWEGFETSHLRLLLKNLKNDISNETKKLLANTGMFYSLIGYQPIKTSSNDIEEIVKDITSFDSESFEYFYKSNPCFNQKNLKYIIGKMNRWGDMMRKTKNWKYTECKKTVDRLTPVGVRLFTEPYTSTAFIPGESQKETTVSDYIEMLPEREKIYGIRSNWDSNKTFSSIGCEYLTDEQKEKFIIFKRDNLWEEISRRIKEVIPS